VTHAPSLKLFGLGIAMLASLLACAYRGTGAASFLVSIAVAGIAYLLAVREFFRTPRYPRHVLLICLALAGLWRIPFLTTPLGPDDDIARYIWDGRVQRFGYNPYSVIPADPALARLHTPQTRGLNNSDLPSPYPAGAELFFRMVTAIHESVWAFKIAFLVCDIGIVLVLFHLLRYSGQGAHWVLAYAWHPLIATEVAGSGHIDILGVLLLLISVAALARRWQTISAIALGLAVAVKFLPIVLIPLYWRRLRVRDGFLGALAFAVPYVPFLQSGKIPIGSLATYVQRFRFNDPVFACMERVASPQFAAGLAVLAGLVAAGWLRAKGSRCGPNAWAWPMAVSLASAPVVYPWYLLWLLPFLRSISTLPLSVWTVSIFSTYLVWYLRPLGHPWRVPGWVLLLEYGSVAMTAVVIYVRQLVRPARSAAAGD
jgi:alpha-1,6-mannosyltransferase